MYDPVKDGLERSVDGVAYDEATPPAELSELVHCFWDLHTERVLDEDVTLHAMPDACVNVLLNQLEPDIAGITQLQTEYVTLPLGRSFHYAGIQFFPGVWRGDPEQTVDHYVGEAYEGDLPLVALGRATAELPLADKVPLLAAFVEQLVADGLVAPNPVTAAILTRLDEIQSVADMAEVAAMSSRQLQRTLKGTTGFSPHELLKVLRIQQSFRRDYQLTFADQSHFTHSFKRVTGYTPGAFAKTFDV